VSDFWPEAIAIIGVVGSGGVAFGVVRASVTSTRSWLKGVNDDLAKHVESDNDMHMQIVQRLARIETKIDDALKRE